MISATGINRFAPFYMIRRPRDGCKTAGTGPLHDRPATDDDVRKVLEQAIQLGDPPVDDALQFLLHRARLNHQFTVPARLGIGRLGDGAADRATQRSHLLAQPGILSVAESCDRAEQLLVAKLLQLDQRALGLVQCITLIRGVLPDVVDERRQLTDQVLTPIDDVGHAPAKVPQVEREIALCFQVRRRDVRARIEFHGERLR